MPKLISAALWGFFGLVVLAPLSRADTHVANVAVRDLSGPGSPMTVSGEVQILENTSAGQVTLSVSDVINAVNISPRTILTLVASLDVTPSFASGRQFTTELECFFGPDVIRPGDRHSLSLRVSRQTTEPYDPNNPPKPPRADVRIVYVQFLDGSTFGHEADGKHLLELRRITWRHLRQLDKTYSRSGATAFVEELMEQVGPVPVDTFFQSIRQTQVQFGTQAAIAQVQTALKFADEHQAGFTE